MTKKWYSVINYENCIECGECIDICSHGVYEKGTNKPNVIYTEGCVEGCRGCQTLCPVDAIEYVGDTSSDPNHDCGCSCNC